MTTTHFPSFTCGKDALSTLSDLIGIRTKVLIVGGRTALEKSRDKMINALKDVPSVEYEFFWYGGECTYKNIENVQKKIQAGNFDLVIGVGGGKALDTGKAAADIAGVEIITVPTIASTCAASTALSVVYNDDGSFLEVYYLKRNPPHILIDLDVISNSPWRYLRAGIGDTFAKYYELNVNQREKRLLYNDMLGQKISSLCAEPLFSYGVKALEAIKKQQVSFELEQVILNIIISTGFVSFLVDQQYNGGAAHGVFYGLTLSKEVEQNFLHGEMVAYGLLVLQQLDKNETEFEKLYSFFKEIGLPTSIQDLNLSLHDKDMNAILEKAVNSLDMQKMPFKVTAEMLMEAMKATEAFKCKILCLPNKPGEKAR